MNPEKLPEPSTLKNICQSIAVLDALICPEWEMRYFSFDAKWSKNEQMASMRNGEGDDYFILFSSSQTAIKGCLGESDLSGNPAFYSNIEKELGGLFRSFFDEPAFSMDEASFVYFYDVKNTKWKKVGQSSSEYAEHEDGSDELLQWIIGGADFYQQWAKEYYEEDIDPIIVKKVFNHQRLTEEEIKTVNPELELKAFFDDLQEIGYPIK
jgi:hypothetical protein